MRKISDLAPRPSDAIVGMVDGIRKGIETDDFYVDMGRFLGMRRRPDGDDPGLCSGCAATLAIIEIAGLDFPTPRDVGTAFFRAMLSDSIEHYPPYAEETNLDHKDVYRFERAIDNLRNGWFHLLGQYYDPHFEERYDESLDEDIKRGEKLWVQIDKMIERAVAANFPGCRAWRLNSTGFASFKVSLAHINDKEDQLLDTRTHITADEWLKYWRAAADYLKREGF